MQNNACRIGFEAFTEVVMKSSFFWNKTPRKPLIVDVSGEHIPCIFRAEKQAK